MSETNLTCNIILQHAMKFYLSYSSKLLAHLLVVIVYVQYIFRALGISLTSSAIYARMYMYMHVCAVLSLSTQS